jgi:catechol 2,3-dioxygenase-like lactoylglutathione lyase family enzyme
MQNRRIAMASSNPSSPIFHIGIVVPDIEVAKDQLGKALGLTWGEQRRDPFGDWELEQVTSMEGPPFVELQEGSPGSPWDAHGQARFDHVQRWTADRALETSRLEGDGMTVEVDGDDYDLPFCYFRTANGLRVELIDEHMKSQFRSLSGIEVAGESG